VGGYKTRPKTKNHKTNNDNDNDTEVKTRRELADAVDLERACGA
jgi:hypothetical protein